MLKNISIRNFKSIKELDFKAKRVNVFIGEPNTGKSNILEALGMFSLAYIDSRGKDEDVPIRYSEVSNLFRDNEISSENNLLIEADHYSSRFNFNDNSLSILEHEGTDKERGLFRFQLNQKHIFNSNQPITLSPIKFYQFKVLNKYNVRNPFGQFLTPPYGNNLYNVLLSNKELRTMVSQPFVEQEYRLTLRQKGEEIEATKIVDDLLYAYPYQTISDSLQRVIFYSAIIATNKNSTILLEEPESHMSPFYIRDIADRIAHDTNNQYFLVTHNPYFLVTLVEKTKRSDLLVSVTYLEDYQTKLKSLSKENLEELTDLDTAIFFNLDKFTEIESVV